VAKLNINGKQYDVAVPADTPLLWVLRDEIGLTGTKFGCGMALCGACTIHIDGQPGRACVTRSLRSPGKKVVTIEAIGADKVGKAVQAAWTDSASRNAATARRADHVRDRASEAEAQAYGRRHRLGHEWQHLPLWNLRPHPRRHQARCR
jgi:succinate dehydrogenase/fumarate reductase-like Fe-S protein